MSEQPPEGPPPVPPTAPPPSTPPPGWPAQPPGQWQGWAPYTPPKRSRRTLWIVLGTVFVLVASCSTFVGLKVFHAEEGARQAANAFLNAAERGDTQAALALACPETRPTDIPHVTHHSFRAFSIVKGGGKTTATITYELTFADSGEERDALYLEKRDGHWLVCGAQKVG